MPTPPEQRRRRQGHYRQQGRVLGRDEAGLRQVRDRREDEEPVGRNPGRQLTALIGRPRHTGVGCAFPTSGNVSGFGGRDNAKFHAGDKTCS